MDEQVYKELYQIYCEALTKKSLAEVQEHFKNSGVGFTLEIHNGSSDPMFNFTTVILHKSDTTLRIDTTDLNDIIEGVID
jgi:hypothetical protein